MSILQKLKQAKHDENTRSVLINMVITFLVKGLSLFLGLFTTPAYIAYFSNDAILGVWFTILSVLTWILTFDMGIGNGVRNKLVESLGKGDRKTCKTIISSAYIFLVFLSAIIIVIVACLFPLLNWNNFFGIATSQLPEDTLLTAILIVFIGIILQFVLRLISSISYAFQNAFVANLLHLCSNIIIFVYVFTSNAFGTNGSIVRLALVYCLAVNLPLVALSVGMFSTKLRDIRPSVRFFDFACAKGVLHLGLGFLYLQLIAMLLDNTASFLISKLIGPEQVVDYQLYHKIFSVAGMIISIAVIPMWSAITKALVERRYAWLRRSVRLMFGVVGLSFLFQLILLCILQPLFNIWLGPNTRTVNYVYALVYAVYGTCCTWQQVCSYVQNGIGKLKLQGICLTCAVIASFTLSFIFAKTWASHIAVVSGIVTGYLVSCTVQTIWISHMMHKLPSDAGAAQQPHGGNHEH